MPIYHRLGDIPKKRHTVFRRPDGGLYAEELMGHEGFVGTSSLLYHSHPPTTVKSARRIRDIAWAADDDTSLRLIAANPAAAALTGKANAELIGKRILDAYPELAHLSIAGIIATVARSNKPLSLSDVEYENDEQGYRSFSLHVFPL